MPDTMQRWRYMRWHNGQRVEDGEMDALSELQALQSINDYNRLGFQHPDHHWQYVLTRRIR